MCVRLLDTADDLSSRLMRLIDGVFEEGDNSLCRESLLEMCVNTLLSDEKRRTENMGTWGRVDAAGSAPPHRSLAAHDVDDAIVDVCCRCCVWYARHMRASDRKDKLQFSNYRKSFSDPPDKSRARSTLRLHAAHAYMVYDDMPPSLRVTVSDFAPSALHARVRYHSGNHRCGAVQANNRASAC